MTQPATVQPRAAAHKAGYLITGGVQSMMIPLHPCTTAPAGVLALDTLTHVQQVRVEQFFLKMNLLSYLK